MFMNYKTYIQESHTSLIYQVYINILNAMTLFRLQFIFSIDHVSFQTL